MLQSPIVDQLNLVYGAEIDATLVFDIDESAVLAGVEVLAPRRVWSAARTLPPRPEHLRKGCLAVQSPTTHAMTTTA